LEEEEEEEKEEERAGVPGLTTPPCAKLDAHRPPPAAMLGRPWVPADGPWRALGGA
jgi:hypothetical protein